MKKTFLLFLITLQLSIYGKINYSTDHKASLIRFIYTMINRGDGSETYQYIYKNNRSKDDQKKDQKYFNQLKNYLNSTPSVWDSYPGTNKPGKIRYRNYLNTIEVLASVSKDMDQFLYLLSSILPVENSVKLFEVIKYFDNIYLDIFHNRSEKFLIKLKQQFDQNYKRDQKFLKMIKNFFGVKEVQDINIVLAPLPLTDKQFNKLKKSKKLVTRGKSIGNLQIVEFLTSKQDKKMDVIFHEITHLIYKLSQKENKWFKEMENVDPVYGKYSSKYLNEALATAIGNGFIGDKIYPKRKDKNWYDNKIIDQFAHQIYPLVKKYFNQKKVIDKQFLKEAVLGFKKLFPKVDQMNEVIFSEIFLVGQDYSKLNNSSYLFRKYLKNQSEYRSSPLNHPKTVDHINNRKVTQIYLISEKDIKYLNSYKQFPKRVKNGEIWYRFSKKLSSYQFIFIYNSVKELEKMVKKISKIEILKKENNFKIFK